MIEIFLKKSFLDIFKIRVIGSDKVNVRGVVLIIKKEDDKLLLRVSRVFFIKYSKMREKVAKMIEEFLSKFIKVKREGVNVYVPFNGSISMGEEGIRVEI